MKHFNVYAKFDRFAYRMDMIKRRRRANHRVMKKQREALTSQEKLMFENMWRGWRPESTEFYKAFCGRFDEKYVPNDYYDFAEHVLNLRWGAFFLQHKCCLKYIVPEENRPHTIVQKIDGHYVHEDNTEITIEEAKELLRSRETFICKTALGSGGGKGVQRICLSEEKDPEGLLDAIMKPADLIFQDVIVQDAFMAGFNADSVNTFRLLTLNINGYCSVLSSFIRMGSKGSFVDNLSTGGGVLVGVSNDGAINQFGIRKDYSKAYMAPSGLTFEGLSVPSWENIKETVVGFHRRIPFANLIGWDVAMAKDGTPIVIEINLDNAEVEAHQIFNGPVFGERLNEVKKYIENKKPLLRHAMVTY